MSLMISPTTTTTSSMIKINNEKSLIINKNKNQLKIINKKQLLNVDDDNVDDDDDDDDIIFIERKIPNNNKPSITSSSSIPLIILDDDDDDDDDDVLNNEKNSTNKNDKKSKKGMIRLNIGGGAVGGGGCGKIIIPSSSSSSSSTQGNKSTIYTVTTESTQGHKSTIYTAATNLSTATKTTTTLPNNKIDDIINTASFILTKQNNCNHQVEIEEDIRLLSTEKNSISTFDDDHSYHHHIDHKQNNNNTTPSPLSSNSSETSSAVSSCSSSTTSSSSSSTSSDHDQCFNDLVDIDLLPDSPDSGVGVGGGVCSINHDVKSFYEESADDYYQSIFPTPAKSPMIENFNSTINNVTIPPYIGGDKCDSLLDLIQLKQQRKINDEMKHKIWRPVDLINCSGKTTDKTTTEHIISENHINDPIPNQNQDQDDLIKFSKEIESVVLNLEIGKFDLVLQAMYCDDDRNDNDDNVEDEDDQQSSFDCNSDHLDENQLINGFEFGFDFPMDQQSSTSMNKSDSTDSFELSIRTQQIHTTNMLQTMIKQMKMNAQNLHKNNSQKPMVKKQRQTFCCQWHDCDWPGNYEDLAEHLREIHVELQPFLDSNGKVIKWNKHYHQRSSNRLNNNVNDAIIDFDFDGSTASSSQMDDETTNIDDSDDSVDDDDECCGTTTTTSSTDDNQSSKMSSIATRRRSQRFNQSDSITSISTERRLSKKNSTNTKKLEKFVCLWRGCKVFGKPSLSRNWIERHVLEQHSGPKPFKCIVDGCGQRFRTQNQLEKHVNMHFKTTTNPQQPPTSSSSDQQISIVKKIPPPSPYVLNNSSFEPINCCKCVCHSFLHYCSNCDNQDDNYQIKHRIDKSHRSPSVDSGISLQSTCSSASWLSSSSDIHQSPSSTQQQQQQCLSNIQQKFHYEFHCHTACCCLNKHQQQQIQIQQMQSSLSNTSKISSPSIMTTIMPSSLSLSKCKNKKPLCSATPKVKSVANVDYLDDEFALKLSYELRIRDALMADLNCYPPINCYYKLLNPKQRASSKKVVYNVFKRQLFDSNRRKENVPFDSEVIACKTKSNGQYFYTIKWPTKNQQQYIINAENVNEKKLLKNLKQLLPSTASSLSAAINSGRYLSSYSIFNNENGISRFKLKSNNQDDEDEDQILDEDVVMIPLNKPTPSIVNLMKRKFSSSNMNNVKRSRLSS